MSDYYNDYVHDHDHSVQYVHVFICTGELCIRYIYIYVYIYGAVHNKPASRCLRMFCGCVCMCSFACAPHQYYIWYISLSTARRISFVCVCDAVKENIMRQQQELGRAEGPGVGYDALRS